MAIVKLGDIAKIRRGSSPRPINKYITTFATDKHWAKISDIKNNFVSKTQYFLKISLNEWDKLLICNDGDLLISCSGSPGIIFINNINNCGYHDGFIKLENYENKVKKNFLKYLFIRNKEKLVSKANGSVFKNLNAQLINNFVINLPDLEIQNKIISIIEPFEKYNIHLTKIINILEQIIDKQFLIFNKNDKKILNEKFFLGFNYNSNSYKNFGLYKLFKISNISTDKPTVFIDKPINILEIGDVVTGLSGTIGSAKIIYESNWTLNQRILCIKSKYQNVIKKVIEINKNFLIQIATGSVQKNLTSKQVLELSFDKRLENYFNYFSSKLIININIIINNVNKIISFLIKILLQ